MINLKSSCVFREDIDTPVFVSSYNFATGCIDKVPQDKFCVKVPELFYSKYDIPLGYGLPMSMSYYMTALHRTQGLVAFNFYDVGVTVLAKSGIYVLLLEGPETKYYQELIEGSNLFNYQKHAIGLHKTVVVQLDVPQKQSVLRVDDNGMFLTNKGIVDTGIKNFYDEKEVLSMPGAISAWRAGMDGIILNNNKTIEKFTVEADKFVIC